MWVLYIQDGASMNCVVKGDIPVYEKKTTPEVDVLGILKKVTIFSGMKDEDVERLSVECSILDSKVGDIVLEEGMPATEIFIIIKGQVSVVLNLKNDPFEIIELGAGNCIGEASVIGIQNHSASAVVMEDAQLLVLSRKMLMKIFDTDKSLFSMLILNIAREIARRLLRTDQLLLQYSKQLPNSAKPEFYSQK